MGDKTNSMSEVAGPSQVQEKHGPAPLPLLGPLGELDLTVDCDIHVVESSFSATSTILRSDVPAVAEGIASAMHRAADLPEPIIFDRPHLPKADQIHPAQGVIVDRSDPTAPIRLYADMAELTPEHARHVAAVLATVADEVDQARDEAAVVALAAEMRAAACAPGPDPVGMTARWVLANFTRNGSPAP